MYACDDMTTSRTTTHYVHGSSAFQIARFRIAANQQSPLVDEAQLTKPRRPVLQDSDVYVGCDQRGGGRRRDDPRAQSSVSGTRLADGRAELRARRRRRPFGRRSDPQRRYGSRRGRRSWLHRRRRATAVRDSRHVASRSGIDDKSRRRRRERNACCRGPLLGKQFGVSN